MILNYKLIAFMHIFSIACQNDQPPDTTSPAGYTTEYIVTKWIPPNPAMTHIPDFVPPKHFPQTQILLDDCTGELIENAAEYITTYKVPSTNINLPNWKLANLCELFLAADRVLSRSKVPDEEQDNCSTFLGTNECDLIKLLWHNSPAVFERTKPYRAREYNARAHKFIEFSPHYVTWHKLAVEIKHVFGGHLEAIRQYGRK